MSLTNFQKPVLYLYKEIIQKPDGVTTATFDDNTAWLAPDNNNARRNSSNLQLAVYIATT